MRAKVGIIYKNMGYDPQENMPMLLSDKDKRIDAPVLGEDSAAFVCLLKSEYVPSPGFCGLPVQLRDPGFFL